MNNIVQIESRQEDRIGTVIRSQVPDDMESVQATVKSTTLPLPLNPLSMPAIVDADPEKSPNGDCQGLKARIKEAIADLLVDSPIFGDFHLSSGASVDRLNNGNVMITRTRMLFGFGLTL